MNEVKIPEEKIREAWHSYLTKGEMPAHMNTPWFERKIIRPFIKRMPRSPRCAVCYIPFEGIGGRISKAVWNVEPSKLNPHLCNLCENFATEYHGGVELEISILFVDVRGSTAMAEGASPEEYSKLIKRFYHAATEQFFKSYGFVEKLLGDEVAGFFVPGFAGADHAKVAVETGKRIMKAMGYGASSQPWIPVGIGINTGLAYVGSVNAEGGVSDIAMLGDAVNTAARLTSLAKAGEILISESTRQAAGLKLNGMESRSLKLKGRSEEVTAWALKAAK
ncbi:MAG: adenylate/guanylate cyclase domain-containing protein [Anaerolineales bacterium]|nr:adenylate/guanylate cyclase domain-containing protein [Anaerolineales bacterium]